MLFQPIKLQTFCITMITENIIIDTVKKAFKELLKDCVLRSQEK